MVNAGRSGCRAGVVVAAIAWASVSTAAPWVHHDGKTVTRIEEVARWGPGSARAFALKKLHPDYRRVVTAPGARVLDRALEQIGRRGLAPPGAVVADWGTGDGKNGRRVARAVSPRARARAVVAIVDVNVAALRTAAATFAAGDGAGFDVHPFLGDYRATLPEVVRLAGERPLFVYWGGTTAGNRSPTGPDGLQALLRDAHTQLRAGDQILFDVAGGGDPMEIHAAYNNSALAPAVTGARAPVSPSRLQTALTFDAVNQRHGADFDARRFDSYNPYAPDRWRVAGARVGAVTFGAVARHGHEVDLGTAGPRVAIETGQVVPMGVSARYLTRASIIAVVEAAGFRCVRDWSSDDGRMRQLLIERTDATDHQE